MSLIPLAPLKLACFPARSPLPITALPSMSLIPLAPFADSLFRMKSLWRTFGGLWIAFSILATPTSLFAQALAPSAVPGLSTTPQAEEETIQPTFETQKLARTYILDVPAPRGQITDRTGEPLAQNKLSYNLGISFPTPLDFTDAKAVAFAREKIDKAAKLTGRTIKISDDAILRHYHNRGILPLE